MSCALANVNANANKHLLVLIFGALLSFLWRNCEVGFHAVG